MQIQQQENVHNEKLQPDEVVINIEQLNEDRIKHPLHRYELNVKSFTAWKISDIEILWTLPFLGKLLCV